MITNPWEAEFSTGPDPFYPVYENINPVFMDLYVNDALIVGGVLMLDRVFAVRDDYLGFVGDLAIVDTQGNEDPAGVPLRLPPPDLRNALQRALPLALGGKMPPEGQPNKIPGLGVRWLLTYWPARPTTTAPSTAYQIVPLTDAPSQRVSVTLGGQACRIDIYTKSLNVARWEPGEIIT